MRRLKLTKLATLAEAYGVSKQRISMLRFRFTEDVIRDPARLLEVLLAEGIAGTLRTRLADPAFRTQAAEIIAKENF